MDPQATGNSQKTREKGEIGIGAPNFRMSDIIVKTINSRLFRQGRVEPSIFQIIAWWEVRRVFYNILVGAAGVVSLLLYAAIAHLIEIQFKIEEIDLPDFFLFEILLYGIMANICYSCGEISEILARRIWKDEGKHFGEIAFAIGLLFSIVLTLFPSVLLMMATVLQIRGHNTHF